MVLSQQGPWTFGGLANHIWSVAGSDVRADVSTTFLQPFVSYTTPDAWTFALNTESTYDWNSRQWTVLVNASMSKVTRIGEQLVSFAGGVRYWAKGPDPAPSGWGFRLAVTPLFSKRPRKSVMALRHHPGAGVWLSGTHLTDLPPQSCPALSLRVGRNRPTRRAKP